MDFKGLTEREFYSFLLKAYGENQFLISDDLINFEILSRISNKGFFSIEDKGKEKLLLNIKFKDIYFYIQKIDNNVNDKGILDNNLLIEIIDFVLKNSSLENIKKFFLKNNVFYFLYEDRINKEVLYDIFDFYNKSKFKSDNNILFNFISVFILSKNKKLEVKIKNVLNKKNFDINGKNIEKIIKKIDEKYNPSYYMKDKIDTSFIFFLTELTFNRKKNFTKSQRDIITKLFKSNNHLTFGELGIRHLTLEDRYGEGYEEEVLHNRNTYKYYEKAFNYGLIDELYIEIKDCSNEGLKKNNDMPLCIKSYKVKKDIVLGNLELYRDIMGEDYRYNLIYFIFKKNVKNIKKYLEEYYSKWKNNELTLFEKNYLLVERQLEQVVREIKLLSDKYGFNNIKFNLGLRKDSEIDYLGCILYLNNIGVIEIVDLGQFYNKSILIFNINDIDIDIDIDINREKKKNKQIITKEHNGIIFIYDNNNTFIFRLTPLESKVFKLLKSKMKEGGIHLDNIRKVTKQPSNEATIKTIRDIQSKIKNYNLKEHIKITGRNYYYKLILKDT